MPELPPGIVELLPGMLALLLTGGDAPSVADVSPAAFAPGIEDVEDVLLVLVSDWRSSSVERVEEAVEVKLANRPAGTHTSPRYEIWTVTAE